MMLDGVRQDVFYGVRNLLRTPGSTFIAVLSLALGIGSATAIYSVIYGVIIDPFPYKDVDSLVSIRVGPDARNGRTGYSVDQFLEIAEKNTVFEHTIASTISNIIWTGSGEPQRLRGNHGNGSMFLGMGVPALLGRYYEPSDLRDGGEPVVVLGYKFWDRQFNRDPNVIGRTMNLDGTSRRIIGVMPVRFMFRGADVYIPVKFRTGAAEEGVRGVHVLGRLKPGVSRAQAAASLEPIIKELARRYPTEFPPIWRVTLVSFKETFPSSLSEPLWILFGAVALLLLIACVNTSNLLLVRGIARQREMSIRTALGGQRIRLVRQLLTESLVLGLTGCALGCLFAFAGLRAILSLVPMYTIPDESEVTLSLPVLAFSLAVCFGATVLFGLVPALETAGRQIADPLRQTSRSTGTKRQVWLRSALVVTEVALSVVLMVSAALVMRTLVDLQGLDLGIRADNILTLRIPVSERRYPTAEQRNLLFSRVLERVESQPGVLAAGVNTGYHPMWNWIMPVELPGAENTTAQRTTIHHVNNGYLDALKIRLLEGRAFAPQEIASRRQVALVSRSFANLYGGGGGAVGRLFRLPRLRTPPFSLPEDGFEIIGVVSDTLMQSRDMLPGPEVYLPYTITGMAQVLVVRTAMDPLAASKTIQAQIHAIDAEQPVMEVRSMEQNLLDFVYAGPRFNVVLFALFAGLGLLLTTIGVFGVVAHNVSRQVPEIGLRMALGAGSGDILNMVFGRAMKSLVLGLAIGLVIALPAGRLLTKFLWKVPAFDALAFGVVALLLLAAGAVAALQPAWRALRIQPSIALRYE